jgi:hypothetical protein
VDLCPSHYHVDPPTIIGQSNVDDEDLIDDLSRSYPTKVSFPMPLLEAIFTFLWNCTSVGLQGDMTFRWDNM